MVKHGKKTSRRCQLDKASNYQVRWESKRSSPRHGSFLTRNSSSATQPPPTLTITVLRRIRTRRSFWDSPNWQTTQRTLL